MKALRTVAPTNPTSSIEMNKLLNASDRAVFGHSMRQEHFRIPEVARRLDPLLFSSVLNGALPGLVVREFISQGEARQLAQAFSRIAKHERTDGVPAHQLGPSHYKMRTADYFEAVAASAADISNVFAAAHVDLATVAVEALQRALDPGQVLRPALWKGRKAPVLRAAAWAAKGDQYALAPHDDLQQLRTPEQADFEVQQVRVPVALNIYTRMPPGGGGQLRVFNMQPTLDCKKELGIERTGYPYPPALLDKVSYIDIHPEPGDAVVLNGSFVHAVVRWNGAPGSRQVWNGFVGLLPDSSTAIHFT